MPQCGPATANPGISLWRCHWFDIRDSPYYSHNTWIIFALREWGYCRDCGVNAGQLRSQHSAAIQEFCQDRPIATAHMPDQSNLEKPKFRCCRYLTAIHRAVQSFFQYDHCALCLTDRTPST